MFRCVLSVALLGIVASCYKPSVADCQYTCQLGTECPTGTQCFEGVCKASAGVACAVDAPPGGDSGGDDMGGDDMGGACDLTARFCPEASATQVTLKAIWGKNDNSEVVAVGEMGTIVRKRAGAWTLEPSSAGIKTLEDIDRDLAGNEYIAGEQLMLTRASTATTWTLHSAGSAHMVGVVATANSTWWIGTDMGNGVAAFTDDPAAAPVLLAGLVGPQPMRGIAAYTPSVMTRNVLAVGASLSCYSHLADMTAESWTNENIGVPNNTEFSDVKGKGQEVLIAASNGIYRFNPETDEVAVEFQGEAITAIDGNVAEDFWAVGVDGVLRRGAMGVWTKLVGSPANMTDIAVLGKHVYVVGSNGAILHHIFQ